MRLRFIWTGKTRDARLRSLSEDYLKRLGHFVRCQITELRETVGSDPKSGIEKDSKRISDALHSGTVMVLLDPDGSAQRAFRLRGLPTSYFIDRQGIIKSIYIGTMTPEIIEARIGAIVGS